MCRVKCFLLIALKKTSITHLILLIKLDTQQQIAFLFSFQRSHGEVSKKLFSSHSNRVLLVQISNFILIEFDSRLEVKVKVFINHGEE